MSVLDLMVVDDCTNLKHWKVEKKKSSGRCIGLAVAAWQVILDGPRLELNRPIYVK